VTSLSPTQLKRATRLILHTASELCALVNQHPAQLTRCDARQIEHSVKGALLREVIIKLGRARGTLPPAEGDSFLASVSLLKHASTCPPLPLLCEEQALRGLERQALSDCYLRYTRSLDELLTADQRWSQLTESTLGSLSEGLTGFMLRRSVALSVALSLGRGQRRWVSVSKLRRMVGKRPTARRLGDRLGLSAKRAERALTPHPQATEKLSALAMKLSARGVDATRVDELCETLSPIYRLLSLDPSGLPLIACEGELILEEGAQRRQRGAHYTPTPLAQEAVSLLSAELYDLGGLSARERLERLCSARICDPAVGGGVFLIEHIRALVDRHASEDLSRAELRSALVQRAVFGADIDPLAVEVTRASLWLLARSERPLPELERHVRCADSLSGTPSLWGELGEGSFSLVICNPPYLNGVEGSWKGDATLKRRLKRLYPHSAIGTYDSAELFWERCCQLLTPDGRYALLTPTVQLSNQGPFKRWLHAYWRPTHLRLYALQTFTSARVRTALIIGARGASERVSVSSVDPQLPIKGPLEVSWRGSDENWYARLSQASAPLGSLSLEEHPLRLSERFTVHSGCATGVAYELGARVLDQRQEGGAGPMLITTGLIERYHHRWGEREARYLKRDYAHPRWPQRSSLKSLNSALSRQRPPKVLVAGLSAVLEATCDLQGACAGVVQTWALKPIEGLSLDAQVAQCELLCAYLNSAAMSYHFVERYGAAAMSGRQITVKKKALLSLPLPKLSEPEALCASLTGASGVKGGALCELQRALIDALRQQQSVDERLFALSQAERDTLTIFTHRALQERAPYHDEWWLYDELAHTLVSVSFGHPSAPVLEWWRARARVRGRLG